MKAFFLHCIMRDLPRNPGTTAQHLLQEIEQVSFQVHRKKQFDKPGASTHDLDLRRLTENERAELQTTNAKFAQIPSIAHDIGERNATWMGCSPPAR